MPFPDYLFVSHDAELQPQDEPFVHPRDLLALLGDCGVCLAQLSLERGIGLLVTGSVQCSVFRVREVSAVGYGPEH